MKIDFFTHIYLKKYMEALEKKAKKPIMIRSTELFFK
jgi:hypothetical protein